MLPPTAPADAREGHWPWVWMGAQNARKLPRAAGIQCFGFLGFSPRSLALRPLALRLCDEHLHCGSA